MIRFCVGLMTVIAGVGAAEGTADGAGVGVSVGFAVGANVGVAVGIAVGADVGGTPHRKSTTGAPPLCSAKMRLFSGSSCKMLESSLAILLASLSLPGQVPPLTVKDSKPRRTPTRIQYWQTPSKFESLV